MSQWEYRTIYLSEVPRRTLATDLLNELGRDGWELVCIVPNGVAYLKREIAPSSSRRRVRGETRASDPE
jgi:hypothetical protein